MNRLLPQGAARRPVPALLSALVSGALLTVFLPFETIAAVKELPYDAAATHDKKHEGEPVFTINRVHLTIIHAMQGEARVLLPPVKGHHPHEVLIDAVDNALKALDRIRKQYPFANLKLVSQSPYLLQLVHVKGGGYEYLLNPEPGGVAYTTGDFRGVLSAETNEGRLSMELSVLRQEEQVFAISLQLSPGRALVLGQSLPDGNALFAVLTVETPDSSPHQTGTADRGDNEVENRIQMSWDVPPRLIHAPQPEYPDIAYRAGVEGTVTLHVVVGTDGRVEKVEVANSSPGDIFTSAAIKAVLEWKYKPASVNGIPIRTRCSQTLRFVLSDDSSLLN